MDPVEKQRWKRSTTSFNDLFSGKTQSAGWESGPVRQSTKRILMEWCIRRHGWQHTKKRHLEESLHPGRTGALLPPLSAYLPPTFLSSCAARRACGPLLLFASISIWNVCVWPATRSPDAPGPGAGRMHPAGRRRSYRRHRRRLCQDPAVEERGRHRSA